MIMLRSVDLENKGTVAAVVEIKRLELRLGNHGRRHTINTRPMIADPPSPPESVQSISEFTFEDPI